MGLQIAAIVLVLAVMLMHSMFGLFSGLINVVCTILSAMIAFGFYEPLTNYLTSPGGLGLNAAYTEPITLVVLFAGSLGLLRYLADKFIRGNVHVPAAVDWVGGGICGFINAEIMVGVMVLGVLMLPIGGDVMGFSRYERTEERDPDHGDVVRMERQHLWLRPDEFTVGLVNLLSNGSMKPAVPITQVYPDLVDAVFFARNTVQQQSTPVPYRDKKGDGFNAGLRVEQWWDQAKPLTARYREGVPTEKTRGGLQYKEITYAPAPGKKLVGARLLLQPAAADRIRNSSVHYFRPTMLRLVGDVGSGQDPVARQYPARIIGGADEKISGVNRVVDMDNNFRLAADADAPIDVYFEVDDSFQPEFVEYRHRARAPMTAAEKKNEPPAVAIAAKAEALKAVRQAGEHGTMLFNGTLEFPFGDWNKLPFDLSAKRTRGGEANVEGIMFVSGRIMGDKTRLSPELTEQTRVEEFKVPPGKRLCQVRFKPSRGGTLAGQVFNYVEMRVTQYKAKDDRGNTYDLAGYYAIVKRGKDDYLELFYNGDPASPVDPSFRFMLDFKEVKANEVSDQPDSILCLLFLTNPGVSLTRVENQQGKGLDVALPMGG